MIVKIKMQYCCTMVAWECRGSAPFWPILCPDGRHLATFVQQWWPINYYPAVFLEGCGGNNLGNSLNSDSVVLALLIDFSVPPRLNKYGLCTLYGCEMCN